MDIERRDDDIVYFESLEGAVLSIDIDGSPCTVDPTSLQSLTEIRDHASGVDPDEIAAVPGTLWARSTARSRLSRLSGRVGTVVHRRRFRGLGDDAGRLVRSAKSRLAGTPLRPGAIVATETIHTLIGQLSVDQACNDVQWLL